MASEGTNKWTNKKKIIILVLISIILIFYFKIFFTRGVYFEEAFLKKEVVGSEYHYKGNNGYGDMLVTVKGEAEEGNDVNVTFNLPNNIYKEFTVTFNKTTNYKSDIEIEENSKIIFNGEYNKDSSFLRDNNGEIIIDNSLIRVTYNNESPFNADYKVPLINVVEFSLRDNEQKRGAGHLVFLAFFLFGITIFDYKYPLFFFNLKHILSVRDPEPSDFYIFMQKISWYVMPITGVVLMILALFPNVFK
ncbi:hypothetical protein [Vallitalea maricola]|uniref:Uncharacterized protein n=1 Tax=Vallitalea maricola TaxID=3074433 RepID=A0ACB5URE4_9FIRM|nr:hypothetical protein AN2V17_44690 [Vallitalea sp. AN17-2]